MEDLLMTKNRKVIVFFDKFYKKEGGGGIMFIRIEKEQDGTHELFIATTEEDADRFTPGSVFYRIGRDEVTICSTMVPKSFVAVGGSENLQLLRDAFIQICAIEGLG